MSACQGILPTNIVLYARKIGSSTECEVCFDGTKSVVHVLWSFPFANCNTGVEYQFYLYGYKDFDCINDFEVLVALMLYRRDQLD